MIHLIRKHAKAALVSLVVVAISLPMIVMAAIAPAVTTLPVIQGGGPLPNSVVVAPDGSLYVGNPGGVISQLDPYGKFIRVVNTEKIYSNALAFAQDGTLLAATNQSVVRLALDGKVLGMLPATFANARSLAVDDLGFIYVVDTVNSEIHVFNPAYQYVSRFGSKGVGPGQLMNPAHIVFDKVSRNLLVADMLNNRIQVFDVNGNVLNSFGTAAVSMNVPVKPLEFHSPQSVAIEYTKAAPQLLNRLYVVDTLQQLVQVIDPAGYVPLLFPGTSNNFIVSPVQMTTPTYATFDQLNGRLLVAGSGGISVFGVDGGGNPLDTTPPTLFVTPPLATVSVPQIYVGGTMETGAVVSVVSNATVAPIEYFGVGMMSWRTTLSALTPGANTFTVTAKDAAGNVTKPYVFTFDYLLPAPALSLSPISQITNASAIAVNGTVDAGSIVKVKNVTSQVEVDAVVSGTTWTSNVSLVEGLNSLVVSAKGANTQSVVKESVITLDTVVPKLSVSALSSGSSTSSQIQNIAGSVVDAGQVAVLVNSVPVDVVDGAFSTAVTLSEGQNQIIVIASDVAGNTVQDVRTLNFDGTKPVITIADATLADNATTNNAVYTISGLVSEAAQITVAGTQVAVDESNNWFATVNLLAGNNTIEVVATDSVGNTSSVKRTVNYAAEKLDLAIAKPAQDFATNSKKVTFTGTVTNSSSVNLSYSVNNGVVTAITPVDGTYKFHVDFKDEGTYSVAITAKDQSGLSTTAVRTVIYDKTPPRFTLNKRASSLKVLQGAVEAGATITTFVNNRLVNGLVVVNGTEWALNVKNMHTAEQITLKATDAAGNETTIKP